MLCTDIKVFRYKCLLGGYVCLGGQVHYFLAKLGVGFISVDIYVRRYKGELSFSGEAHQLHPSSPSSSSSSLLGHS